MDSHEKFKQQILAGPAAPQDVSLPVLEDLFSQGYTNTTWHTNAAATDAECLNKDGEQQALGDFLTGLMHAAPFYEKTHVGCRCTATIEGEDMIPVEVSAFGVVGEGVAEETVGFDMLEEGEPDLGIEYEVIDEEE